jgi:hypothetical protein
MKISQVLLILSVISNVTVYIIYLRLIIKNKIKPHAITYLVWVIILALNFIIQILSGVGIGSILLATNLTGCFLIFAFCYVKGYIVYDKIDWLCFVLAIIAVLLWFTNKIPLYSVVLSCVIDWLALAPSFRKSFSKPNEDSSLTFFISALEYLLSFPSYKILSVITLLYPSFVLSIDFIYSAFILIRRTQLKPKL